MGTKKYSHPKKENIRQESNIVTNIIIYKYGHGIIIWPGLQDALGIIIWTRQQNDHDIIRWTGLQKKNDIIIWTGQFLNRYKPESAVVPGFEPQFCQSNWYVLLLL